MPKILLMTDKAVFIECEYAGGKGSNEIKIAEKVSATYCRPRCGYFRDASIRKIKIACFHPNSPYLKEFKQKIAPKLKNT